MIPKSIFKPLLTVMFLAVQALTVTAGETAGVRVIKNPRPTTTEKQYVRLIESGSIDEDLGNGQFLFKPKSCTADKSGHLYVYDGLQAKVFRFDRDLKPVTSFGSEGRGPGEFSGTGKTQPVYIKIAADGNLYANDLKARKVLVFKPDGRYIKDIKYGMMGALKKPLVDAAGNLHVLTVDDRHIIRLATPAKQTLFTLGAIKDTFFYLFHNTEVWQNIPQGRRKYYLHATLLELNRADMTKDGKILLYFPTGSLLIVMKEGKILQRIKLWPKEALAFHEKNLPQVMKQGKGSFRDMFFNFFVDEDDPNLFYLQLGRNREKKINLLYQFHLNGKVLKVFFIPYNQGDRFTLFKFKHNGRFLAVREEKIIFFKEETKK
jgi:hypothetical protein